MTSLRRENRVRIPRNERRQASAALAIEIIEAGRFGRNENGGARTGAGIVDGESTRSSAGRRRDREKRWFLSLRVPTK